MKEEDPGKMLKEYPKIRQDKNAFRRLFIDDLFNLYVWYNDATEKKRTGFQLVYHCGVEDKALTWTEADGFLHARIDDGDKKINQSPILLSGDLFGGMNIVGELERRMDFVDNEIRIFVLEKIKQYVSDL